MRAKLLQARFTTDNLIIDSFNTSSSTDNETGHYTITLTSASWTTLILQCLRLLNENRYFILGNRERAAGSYGIRIKKCSLAQDNSANTGSFVIYHGDLA